MRSSPRYRRLALLLALGLLAAAGCAAPAGQPSGGGGKGTVRIGVLTSLTGSAALAGNAVLRTWEYAVDEMHSGKLDTGGWNVELVPQDDTSVAEQALVGARKLVQQDEVPMVAGPFATPAAKAVNPFFVQSEVLGFSFTGSASVVTDWTAQVQVADFAAEGPPMVKALGAGGASKIAIFRDKGPTGDGYLAGFTPAASAAGLQVVSDQQVDAATTDVSSQITAMRSAGAQAVACLCYQTLPAFVRGIAQVGWTVPVVGGSGLQLGQFQSLPAELKPTVNEWVRTSLEDLDGNPRAKAFRDAFVAAKGDKAYQGVLNLANYDTARLLAAALATMDKVDPAALRTAMWNLPAMPAVLGGEPSSMDLAADRMRLYNSEKSVVLQRIATTGDTLSVTPYVGQS